MCKNNTQAFLELNNEVIRVVEEVEPQLFQNVTENCIKSIDICGVTRSGQLIKKINFNCQ